MLGMIAAFLGIGGGPLNLSALMLFAGMPLKAAALYSVFIILFAQGANLINWAIPSPWHTGTWPLNYLSFSWVSDAQPFPAVSIAIIATVVTASIIGAIIGATLYKKLNNSSLKKIYCSVLIFVLLVSVWNLIAYFS